VPKGLICDEKKDKKMEMLDYLGTADFLNIRYDGQGKELTIQQKIKKIKNWLQNGIIPRSTTSTIGREILFIKEELEKFVASRQGIKARN
jgi:hypothetical protein